MASIDRRRTICADSAKPVKMTHHSSVPPLSIGLIVCLTASRFTIAEPVKILRV